jgi:phage FluMu protein Com
MTVRCITCGRVLPAGSFSRPSSEDYCSVKCARERGAGVETVRRLQEAGRLEPE